MGGLRQSWGQNRRILGTGLGRLCGWECPGEEHSGPHHPDSTLPTSGEACWWTMHPASKQRSEGEKVRVGDDLILVSVSSERYLVSNPTSITATTVPGLGTCGIDPISPSLVCLLSGPSVLTPDSSFLTLTSNFWYLVPRFPT